MRLAERRAARAGVPSGASTGSREAVERRDGDRARYAAAKGFSGRCPRSTPRSVTCCAAGLGLAGRGGPGHDRPRRHRDEEAAPTPRSGSPRWRWPGRWPPRPGSRYGITPDGVTSRCRCRASTCLTAACTQLAGFPEFMIAPVGAPSLGRGRPGSAEVWRGCAVAVPPRALHRAGRRGRVRPEIAEPGRGPPPDCPGHLRRRLRRAATACRSPWTWPPGVPPAGRPLPGGRRSADQR